MYTASMLTVLRLISLTAALAAGSARVTDHGASTYIIVKWRTTNLYFSIMNLLYYNFVVKICDVHHSRHIALLTSSTRPNPPTPRVVIMLRSSTVMLSRMFSVVDLKSQLL